jgi:hypothetical protein
MSGSTRNRPVCLCLLVWACLLLFPRLSHPETPPKPQKPTDEEILKRILANWRARQDRTRSLHFEWNTRFVQKFGRRTWTRDLRRALWVAGTDRFRFERALVGDGENFWDLHARDQRAYDGSTSSFLEWLRKPSDPPQGAIRPDQEMRVPDEIECVPLYLAFRPSRLLIDPKDPQFRVVSRNAILDNVHCVKIQRYGNALEICWVDPNRDDVILLREQIFCGRRGWRLSIEYQRSPQMGWLPSCWTCHRLIEGFFGEETELQCQATTSAVNERLSEHLFRIDFPSRTLLFDVAAHKQYVIAADGSRTAAPPFDSVTSPAFRRALDADQNTRFQPEPFKGVVDYLRNDDKLPVELDDPAFRAAGLSVEKTECQCDIDGLSMREKLHWLSAQFPKPIRLEEKDGKLVLTPDPDPKPAAPGNQRAVERK